MELRLHRGKESVLRGFRFGAEIRIKRLNYIGKIRVEFSGETYDLQDQGDSVIIPEGENTRISIIGIVRGTHSLGDPLAVIELDEYD